MYECDIKESCIFDALCLNFTIGESVIIELQGLLYDIRNLNFLKRFSWIKKM